MIKNKKIILIFLIILIVGIMAYSGNNVAKAEEISLMEMVELLVSLDVISAEQADLARHTALSITNYGWEQFELE